MTMVFSTNQDVIEREILPTLVDIPVEPGQINAILERAYGWDEDSQGFVCVVDDTEYWRIVESVLSDPGELPA